jgi:pantetheine-phosphate adenylyltransferase
MNADGTTRAIYPGSFDPLTNGHEDLIRRALRFADHLIIAIAHRATHVKQGLFTVPERVAMIREVFADEPRVEVEDFQGLLVDLARQRNAPIIIRGLRAVSDFEYEFQMALMNRSLWSELETIFLAPDARYSFLSSSLVREIASLGGDVSEFVRPEVAARLRARIAAPAS